MYPLGQGEVLFTDLLFLTKQWEYPPISYGHMNLTAQCVSDDPTGMCPAEMSYDFASPEVVVKHLGYIRVVYSVSTGAVRNSNIRTEAVRGPYDDFQNS